MLSRVESSILMFTDNILAEKTLKVEEAQNQASANAGLDDILSRVMGLERDVASLGVENHEKAKTIAKQSKTIAKQSKTIAKQSKTIAKLETHLRKAEATIVRLEHSLARKWRSKPSSEKGSSGSGNSSNGEDCQGSGGNGGDGGGSPPKTAKEIYHHRVKNKDPKLDYKKLAKQHKMSLKQYWESLSSDDGFLPPNEDLMGSGIANVSKESVEYRHSESEKIELFGKSKGLGSSYDYTTSYHLDFGIREVTATVETLRDESQIGRGEAALSHRKNGPFHLKGFQINSKTLITIITLHCEFKIPTRRLEKILSPAIFSSSNIGRWVSSSANRFLSIYLALADMLGEGCDYLRTDDTNTHVLEFVKAIKSGLPADSEMKEEDWKIMLGGMSANAKKQHKPDLLGPISERLGRIAPLASGRGAKKKINLTLVCGKSKADDWRSTICFFRTHCGQAGNLITRIYEPFVKGAIAGEKKRRLSIQADCSNQNRVEHKLRGLLKLIYPGCTDHARRPFARYSSEDENLAYTFLLDFLELYNLEREIKCGALTGERILKIRDRGWKWWEKMLQLSKTVVAGDIDPKVQNRKHFSESNLYIGCSYIISNYDDLTLYLKDPQLNISNVYSERKLRPEKMFADSSKFSFSELGSAAKDIHQTIISTCLSAGEDPAEYYSWVLGFDAEEVEKSPKSYTPYAFAIIKASESRKIEESESMEMDDQIIGQTKISEEPQPTLH